jgi:predicted nucleic acid-binding protein
MAKAPMLLDAGIWIASEDVDDRHYTASRELVLDTAVPAAMVELTLYEIVNWSSRRWQDPARATGLCRSAASRCRKRFISVDIGLIEETAVIAVEHRITSYDAAYVAVARRHRWTLVGTDIRDLVSRGLAITPDAAV